MNLKYLGRLKDGKRNGDGRSFWPSGAVYYDGNWEDNQPHGDKCTTFHKNKSKWYVGNLVQGLKEGKGAEYYDNGQVMFEGNWVNNEPYGENIKIFNADGSVMFQGDK